ncbi:hypothetical protein, partial [Dysosmobacter sp.]|uniref:hypothetical protein n=1 Tax=Dysosmobacter sp. TaxID=2591382 RepID=UPI002A8C8C14
AAARRKRLLAQAFCRHLIPHEGAPAPSYSPCKMQPSCFKQWFFDKLGRAAYAALFLHVYSNYDEYAFLYANRAP